MACVGVKLLLSPNGERINGRLESAYCPEWSMRPRDHDVSIVVMQRLRRLAVLDVDDLERVQEIPGIQKVVVECEDVGMQGEFVKGSGLVGQRIDAVRLFPLESIPSPRRLVGLFQAGYLCFGFFHLRLGVNVRQDNVAMFVDVIDQLLDSTLIRRRVLLQSPISTDLGINGLVQL